MVSVYTINGEVTLDIKPFTSQLTKLNGELNKLSQGFRFDNEAIGHMESGFKALELMMKEVATQASQINKAFSNIEGIKVLIENLNEVRAFLREMGYEIGNNKTKVASVNNELKKSVAFSKEVGLYFANEDKILRMSLRTLREQDNQLKAKLAKSKQETQLAREIAWINKADMAVMQQKATSIRFLLTMTEEELGIYREINVLIKEGNIESVKQAESLLKQLDVHSELYAMLDKEILNERKKLELIEEENAMLKQQTKEREKSAATQGNLLDKPGYLGRRIGSMAVTMWGYQELMDIYETTSANLNARGSMKYFGDQLMTNERYLTQTNQTLGQVRRSLNDYGDDLERLQKKYQKIDMTVIGANAEETAYKYGVQADKLGDLSEVYAVYGSEFVKQGRTQEDSVLAINDALDGEVRRLKEVNIKMEDLKEHGYKEGDTASLIDALNEIAKERGYDITAQNITNLSDAITVLELRISQGLASAFEYIEPLLREVAMDFIYMIDAITWAFGKLNRLWIDFSTWLDISFGVQNVQKFGSSVVRVLGAVITLAITFGIVYKVVKGLKGMIKDLFGMLGKGTDDITKTTGDIAKTGGTVGKDSGGGFRDNFMKQWSKAGKDIGKMARVFADVVVGMAMAFVVIEEAILIISGIGYTYEALKPQFESGIDFIKEFGLWFALLGGAMLVFSYALDKVPDGAEKAITKGATRLAYGMAIAMGLITEAIGLLIAPMVAIALLGGTASFLGTNLDKGLEVITWIGNALHRIDAPIAIFIGGFLAISLLLGLVQPLTLALGVGIASSLLLVTEAIGLLVLPLGAIALLGGTASMLGEENINQGAETIRLIGRVLKVLSEALVDLFIVDIATLGVNLANFASQLITGKTGLQSLVDEIIPDLTEFVQKFNALEMGDPVDSSKVAAVTQMATAIPPLFAAIQKVNNALGASDAIGNIIGGLGGSISGAMGMGLSGKLDQLYNDVRDVMEFAKKLGGLGTGENANTTAITQTANAIAQLKTKLNQFIATISGAAARVQSASNQLGNALTNGFKTGAAGFSVAVVSVMAKGVSEIQSRYATFNSAGKALAEKLASGFSANGGRIKQTIRKEMQYSLQELDNYSDDFYRKGQMLGKQLADGFESNGGLKVGSPARIARTIAKEMEYSMMAIDAGKLMMYKGGQALGQALATGYTSTGNIRTDIGMLAEKGVSNEQLQANAKNVQANTNAKGQTPQLTQNNFNIDMSGATIIGVQDLDTKIRQAVEKAIVSINSPNGAIGY